MLSDTIPFNEPGFDLHADQQGRIVATSVALIVLTTSSSAWLLAALISFVGHGFGRHIYVFGPEGAKVKTRLWLRTLYVFEPMYHTSTTFAKYSMFVLSLAAGLDIIHVDHETVSPSTTGSSVFLNSGGYSGSLRPYLSSGASAHPSIKNSSSQPSLQWPVSQGLHFPNASVVIISIIRVVVLSRIGKQDVTWNYINGGIWAITEPSIAVICACLPSLRPLFAVTLGAMSRLSNFPSKLDNCGNKRSKSSNRWTLWASSHDKSNVTGSGGSFSRLGFVTAEGPAGEPFGHDVNVYGGADVAGKEEPRDMLPYDGIRVKTEVMLISSERLDYPDRLF
ncbi:MAG: hypothetical protein Q9213_002905 [Squamulea squamosa]